MREVCKCCWQINPVGFHVPNEVWWAAVPRSMINKVLCVVCFARFADEEGIEWDADIEFFPLSRKTAEGLSRDRFA